MLYMIFQKNDYKIKISIKSKKNHEKDKKLSFYDNFDLFFTKKLHQLYGFLKND